MSTDPAVIVGWCRALPAKAVGVVLSAKRKRIERPRLLRAQGLSSDTLITIDHADAALCALTARELLTNGCVWFGETGEGFIVVPCGLWTDAAQAGRA